MAQQAGLDLGQLEGRGPHGRIVKADIEAALARKPEQAKPAGAARPRARAGSAGPASRHAARGHPADGTAFGGLRGDPALQHAQGDRRGSPNRSRPSRTSTCRSTASSTRCWRCAASSTRREGADYKLSVNDFVIKAAALALRKVPGCNASWGGDKIYQYKDIDVSVAVAIEGGLITPIIRKADQKGLSTISTEMKDLAKRAKDGKLKPEEFQGGGFSISNLGMYGIKEFPAVINPPQACILAVGAGEQRPVVKGGELKIATVMTCTLSVDHRVVDGALGRAVPGRVQEAGRGPAGAAAVGAGRR